MNQTFIYFLFYLLAGVGTLTFLILLIKIISGKEEIDKNSVTWLIVAFVCIVFPIVGNMTIEYGDLKITITNLRSESKQVGTQLEAIEIENQQLKQQIDNLDNIVVNSRNTLTNQSIPPSRKIEILDQFQMELGTISDQTVSVERKLETATLKNKTIVDELDQQYRRQK